MKAVSLVAVVLMAAVVLAACAKQGYSEEEKALLETVNRYNSQLRLAFLEVNLNQMVPVATENQASKLFPIFQGLRLEDDYMRAELEEFEVEGVGVTGEDKGHVDTREKWVFWWQDHQTNEITKPRAEVSYHVRYNLVMEGRYWKVDSLEDLDPDEK